MGCFNQKNTMHIRPLTQHDADRCAFIHKNCFQKSWDSVTFGRYFTEPEWQGVFGLCVSFTHDGPFIGFIMGRTVFDTNDLLTLAVLPDYQRRGAAKALMLSYIEQIQVPILLEVSCVNTSAIGLYTQMGFSILSKRPHYYAEKKDVASDAYVMQFCYY